MVIDGAKETLSVVIADDEPILLMNMAEALNADGIKVVASVTDGFEAVSACREHHPDVAILDIEMPLLGGLAAAQCIYEEGLAEAIVILTAYDSEEYVGKASELGVFSYLVKPIDSRTIMTSIRMAHSRSLEMQKLRDEIEHTKETLEARKAIERAKGRLMRESGLTEDAAYNRIREISKAKSMSMKEVSQMIMKGPEH